MNAHFSSRLETAMKKRGLTQEGLAAELGITHSAVSRWMSGSLPRPSRLTLLAQVLGVSVSFLEGREELPPAVSYTLKEDTPVYGSAPPDPQRDATLARAREFNDALEPAARKVVKQTLRQLDSLLSTAAYNDGGMRESMIRLGHECLDDFSAHIQKLRDSQKL